MVKIDVLMNERPECIVEGCCNKGQMLGRNKEGYPYFRKYCTTHYRETIAANTGFSSITAWTNSFHPYRQHRKDYCENQDGRLGFVCTANIIDECMLDVDHIDGNHFNNNPSNLQTVCKCCHAYKTKVNEDNKNRYMEAA